MKADLQVGRIVPIDVAHELGAQFAELLLALQLHGCVPDECLSPMLTPLVNLWERRT